MPHGTHSGKARAKRVSHAFFPLSGMVPHGRVRHGRACPGHPRLPSRTSKDVDARDKAGHDDVGARRYFIDLFLRDSEDLQSSISKDEARDHRGLMVRDGACAPPHHEDWWCGM